MQTLPAKINPNDWIAITYVGPSHSHLIYGRSGTNYGYYSNGANLQVLKSDQAHEPSRFQLPMTNEEAQAIVKARVSQLEAELEALQQVTPNPAIVSQNAPATADEENSDVFDFTIFEGIGKGGQDKLEEQNVLTLDDLISLSPAQISKILGSKITVEKAQDIIDAAKLLT